MSLKLIGYVFIAIFILLIAGVLVSGKKNKETYVKSRGDSVVFTGTYEKLPYGWRYIWGEGSYSK